MGITYAKFNGPSVSVTGGGTDTNFTIAQASAADWASVNPVLALGEPGVETDTGVVKVGDGSTAWLSLSPAFSGTYGRRRLRGALEAGFRELQVANRYAAAGTSLVASAAGASSAIASSVSVPSITDTSAGTLNPLFRYSRCTPVQAGSAAFTNQCVAGAGLGSGSSYYGAMDMLAEFDHSGATTVEIRYRAQFTSQIRVLVDGRPVNPTPTTTPTDGNFSYYTLTMPNTAKHRVGIEMGTDFRFLGVYRDPAATITRPQDTLGTRLIVLGDSYVNGTGGTSKFLGFACEAGRLLGLRDVVSSGGGGTGYLSTFTGPPSYGKYRDRLSTDVTPLVTSDTVILVTGGQNDLGSYASVGAEAALLFAAIKAAAPSAVVAVLPPFVVSDVPGNYATMRTGITAAAAATGVTVIADPIAETWITGTGRVGSTTGTGNADYFISSDAAHPSQDGHDYYAVRVAAALRQQLGL